MSVYGIIGPCGKNWRNQGRIVEAKDAASLPPECIYWCKEGDTAWTPIPEALKKADAFRAEQAQKDAERRAKRKRWADKVAHIAFATGKAVEQVEKEVEGDE